MNTNNAVPEESDNETGGPSSARVASQREFSRTSGAVVGSANDPRRIGADGMEGG